MTAVVGQQNAKSAYLTGTAGVLVIAIAFVMMVLAAPSHAHPRPQGAATPPAQTLSRVTQAVFPGGPSIPSARAGRR